MTSQELRTEIYGVIRQRELMKRNFVVMGFVMKVTWQDHTFVMQFIPHVKGILGKLTKMIKVTRVHVRDSISAKLL